ncbi:hypothetical protein [Novosphingobium naphthalenivorans]|uniref:hypothetical protein n=1 Tax=Novosphingobium naphthalenivorans TaxID=273168 RepID=UPI00082B81DB|nr:hypothetical protein [Novosphingobium naphthalenivorans]
MIRNALAKTMIVLALSCRTAAANASAEERYFTLVSGAEVGFDGSAYFTAGNGHHGFFGRGGDIDGEPNPTLSVHLGDKVTVTLLDLDERGQTAQLAVPAFHAETPVLTRNGQSATITFTADRVGSFDYNGVTVFEGRDQHVHMVGQIVVNP